jgi:TonB family protein
MKDSVIRRLSLASGLLIILSSAASCASKPASDYSSTRSVASVEVNSKALQPDPAKLAKMGLTVADVKGPVPIKKVTPGYPDSAKQAGVQGPVGLRCVIGVSGEVSTCVVTRSLSPECDDEAIRAASQWEFTPAKLKGATTAVYIDITVRYRLDTR